MFARATTSVRQDLSVSFAPEEVAEEEEENGVTVTVIGGCGFLGQHLIKLLHTDGYNISLIKVLDFFPFQPELNYKPTREVHSVRGSITCMEDLMVATAEATTVFHLASLTDRSMFPDHQLMDMINVEGTKNVIKACRTNGVQNLIYASDISVIMGQSSIRRGKENSTSYPRVHIHADGPSKAAAEKLVLDACETPKGDNLSLEDTRDPTFKTLALRMVNLYGELDSYLWPRLIHMATLNNGHVPCLGSLKTKVHMMYAGNAAWALLRAHEALTNRDSKTLGDHPGHSSSSSTMDAAITSLTLPIPAKTIDSTKTKTKITKLWQWTDPKSCPDDLETTQSDVSDQTGREQEVARVPVEGKVFFVCDDTPPANYFLFMKAFLRRYGFYLTSWSLPEKWAKRLTKVAYVVLWLLFPFLHINPPLSAGEVHEVCHHYTFSNRRARTELRYTPLFSFKTALQRTIKFYDCQYKEALSGCIFHRALGLQHLSNVRRMSKIKRDILSLDLGDCGERFRGKIANDTWMRGLQ